MRTLYSAHSIQMYTLYNAHSIQCTLYKMHTLQTAHSIQWALCKMVTLCELSCFVRYFAPHTLHEINCYIYGTIDVELGNCRLLIDTGCH